MFFTLIEEFGWSSPSKQALLVAAGVGTVTVGAAAGAYFIKKRIDNTPPKLWRRVGEVNEIYVYPIRSCAPIQMSRVNCVASGPQWNLLRDRIFMVTNIEGKCVTASQKPNMVLIQPQFDDGYQRMTLSAPGMDDITIPIEEFLNQQPVEGMVSGKPVLFFDCGHDVAKWLSTYLVEKEERYRLRFYPPMDKTSHKKNGDDDSGLLQDVMSYMLFNTATVEDLNARLDQNVTALQFRPNFVVKGPPAYAEDDWRWVKIGSTVFKNVAPCLRCVIINIDPEKGSSSVDKQPLKMLKSYRRKPELGVEPALGIYVGLRLPGDVRLGDTVYCG